MFELLASLPVLNPLIGHFFSGKEDAQRHCQNAWIIAVDISQVCPEASFQEEMLNTIQVLKSLPVDEKVGTEILMPGERGYKEREKREAKGVPIPAKMQATLIDLAKKYNVASPF
jgi:ureidoglycolate dehydrogenase (NAD+)/(2R)-3-sulfolactate dehydrogenase (NADP+)